MSYRPSTANSPQPKLPFFETDENSSENSLSGVGLTFRESKNHAVHRWYPYVEGFSAEYVCSKILEFGKNLKSIYDPFGGAGTTQLEASKLGIPSFFSEVNPFMAFVALTKVNATRWARQHLNVFEDCCRHYTNQLRAYL